MNFGSLWNVEPCGDIGKSPVRRQPRGSGPPDLTPALGLRRVHEEADVPPTLRCKSIFFRTPTNC